MTSLSVAKLTPTLDDLTPQQLRFVEEYVFDSSSATRAALRAGYSEADAASYASKLLKMPKIRQALEEIKKQSAERIGLTQDRILLELAKIAFSNPGDIINLDPDCLSKDQLQALGVEVNIRQTSKGPIKDIKLKSPDKVALLIALGKHLGMFKDKVEVSGSVSLEQLVEESMKNETKGS